LVVQAYMQFYGVHQKDLGHYFRNLYLDSETFMPRRQG